MWLHPRATIRRIVDTDPGYCVPWLAAIAGFATALDRMDRIADRIPSPWIALTLALLFGPALGLLTLWTSSVLFRWTGQWLGGVASRRSIRAAIAWSALPNITSLTLALPLVFVPREFLGDGALRWIIDTGFLAIAVWGLVLLCQSLAEVQGYRSAWRAALNILLTVVLAAIPMILVGTLIGLGMR